jgi:hypothetical protein
VLHYDKPLTNNKILQKNELRQIHINHISIGLTITKASAQFSFGNYALQNVNIIDVNSNDVLYDYTIIINNDKISDILPSKII